MPTSVYVSAERDYIGIIAQQLKKANGVSVSICPGKAQIRVTAQPQSDIRSILDYIGELHYPGFEYCCEEMQLPEFLTLEAIFEEAITPQILHRL